jgi:biopolymer transport protein ExbB
MPSYKKMLLGAACALAAASVLASPAFAWQSGWSYRTKVTLTPSATGAAGEVGSQPVLIRLHSGNFSFKDAKGDGSDLRVLSGDDKTALPFQIESWDAQGQSALVWVQVPALSATGSAPLYLYYGNAKAAPGGSAQATFSGQALVWHFAETGAPQDASGNSVTGSAAGGRDPHGLIGQSLALDGTAAVGTPAGFTLGGQSTLSMWIKPGAAGANGLLFTQQGGLTLGLANGVPYAQVGADKAQGSAAIGADGWTHVAVVSDGTKTLLYVNGQPAGQIAAALPAGSGQAAIGQGFAGQIDEVQVAKSALSPGAVAMAANSQGVGAKLAAFDKAEEVKSASTGYFAILFKALTPDAWAVIGLLAVMSLISWVVMITKGLTLGRIASANDAFMEAYEQASVGQSDHSGLADLPQQFTRSGSSLAHLYRVGQRELKKRLAERSATGSRFAIRAQSIAAIRSALDAAQLREGQKLNSRMVLLTIAISGGPFLGLLGTVIGVMITFAAVAAAGDVNINAIAPGIAAALLATVAGLSVAIPALFGYNYLLSRVEEITSDDAIFVDELEKRIAELYQDVPHPQQPLAAE